MSTLTATPNNSTGSVTLNITKTSDVAKVVRMNVNGTEEVRASQGQLPSGAGGVELRRNLAANPSAETNLTGYKVEIGTGGVTADSRGTSGGAVSAGFFRTTWTTGNTAGNAGPSYIQTGITGATGDKLSASLWVRSSTNRTITLEMALNNSGVGNTYADGPSVALTANVWTLIKVENVTATAAYNEIYLWAYSGTVFATGSTMDLDGILLEKSASVGTYFDGDTPDVDQNDYAWLGTAHASASVLKQASSLILTDYEAAHGTNTYNVYAADGSMVTGSVDLVIDKPWLSVPVMPQYSEQVETITQFGAGREANTTVHRPLGRADSLVVMGKLGDRTGSLEIFCKSYTDARRLERIFERGEIVQLRQRVAEMDMYFTATSIPVSPYSVQGEDGTRWSMTINYVEVNRPIGNLAGALGWTFDSMASSAASFDVITAHYSTFDALTLGDANV